jgi:hypothetical protein
VIEKRAAVLNQIGKEPFNGHSSQMKPFVEVAYDLPAQHPRAVDAFLDGFRQQIRRGQRCQNGPEPDHKFDENEAESLQL